MIGLEKNFYGERAVRFLPVQKKAGLDEVAEWEADVLLQGKLSDPYHSQDNASSLSSDALRSTVLAVACDLEDVSRDVFSLALADRFLSLHEVLVACDVEVREKLWTRLAPEGKPHPFFFIREAIGTPFSRVRCERGGTAQRSAGIRGISMMKTAGFDLSGFRETEFRTRREIAEGVLATSLDAEWEYSPGTEDLEAVVIDLMLEVFSETYSTSLQRALFQMGEAALETFPGLGRIRLKLLNKHYPSIDLSGPIRSLERNRIFQPTDDPFGCVEAVVVRNGAARDDASH